MPLSGRGGSGQPPDDAMTIAALPNAQPEPVPDGAFLDAAGCARWLKTIALINAVAAHRQITTRLAALNAVELDAEDRLGILETLRQPVVYVQAEMARGFSGKPLPLTGEARDAFRASRTLWDQMLRGYELCLQGLAGNVFVSVTLALQRALDCVARKMVDHHLAHAHVPDSAYASLHRLYRLAEKLQRATEKVPDPMFQAGELTNCTRTWVRALLLDLASPRDKRPRQLLLVNRLLERWAPKVAVLAAPTADAIPNALYASFDALRGLSREAPVSDGSTRVLDTSSLAKSVAKRIMGLRRGAAPATLGLPDDCHQPGCEALLVGLYRQWCEAHPRRAHTRTDVDQDAEVSLGITSSHYYLSGQPFYAPDNPPTLDGEAYRLKRGIDAQTWRLRDESAGGVGLLRPGTLPAAGEIALDQLVLVRRAQGAPLLCTVQWMLEGERGDVQLGGQLIGVAPRPVAVRCADTPTWQPALHLPPAFGKGDTLLLAPGIATPEQSIEIYTETIQRWRLGALIARGADFERFAAAPAADQGESS
jgi:hypothetical protein